MTIPADAVRLRAVIAVAALIATWVQNAAYFPKGAGFLENFALDLKANRRHPVDLPPTSRSSCWPPSSSW